jgi:hypothetical protein
MIVRARDSMCCAIHRNAWHRSEVTEGAPSGQNNTTSVRNTESSASAVAARIKARAAEEGCNGVSDEGVEAWPRHPAPTQRCQRPSARACRGRSAHHPSSPASGGGGRRGRRRSTPRAPRGRGPATTPRTHKAAGSPLASPHS